MKTDQPPMVYSNLPLPPGRILRREIEYRGVSRNELASQMGCSAQLVDDIINADTPVTPEIASLIEKALGIKAYLWTNLEASYRATLAHNDLVAREGPIHDCHMGENCPARQTYEDDEDDEDEYTYTHDEQPSRASILRDEGEPNRA